MKPALLAAVLAAAVGGLPKTGPVKTGYAPRRNRKPYPTMVCSPAAEIREWNALVDFEKANKLQSKDRPDAFKSAGRRQYRRARSADLRAVRDAGAA